MGNNELWAIRTKKENPDGEMEYSSSTTEYLDALDMSKYPLLSAEKTNALIKKVQDNDDMEAMNLLCLHNSRLVLNVARKYLNAKGKLALDDLMQAGFMGLMDATKNFNPDMDTKFSTYAVYWIKQKILRTIQTESNTIYIPINRQQSVYVLHKAIKDYKAQNEDKPPSDSELLEYINKNKDIYKFEKKLKVTEEWINKARNDATMNNLVPLDKPVGMEDPDVVVGDFVESNQPTPEDIAVRNESYRMLLELAKKYANSERDYNMYLLYYGNIQQYTLQEIGDMYGLSRERVRQVIENINKKIKDTQKVKELDKQYEVTENKKIKNKKSVSKISQPKRVNQPKKTNQSKKTDKNSSIFDAIKIETDEDFEYVKDILTEEEMNEYNKLQARKLLEDEKNEILG